LIETFANTDKWSTFSPERHNENPLASSKKARDRFDKAKITNFTQ
jgi:hypothetical protein